MNVEKMMYNLFNDEETPDKAQASALKRGADLQIPQIDSNEKVSRYFDRNLVKKV